MKVISQYQLSNKESLKTNPRLLRIPRELRIVQHLSSAHHFLPPPSHLAFGVSATINTLIIPSPFTVHRLSLSPPRLEPPPWVSPHCLLHLFPWHRLPSKVQPPGIDVETSDT